MRPKSEIYIPKRDEEHPLPFHMRVPPGIITCWNKDTSFQGYTYFATRPYFVFKVDLRVVAKLGLYNQDNAVLSVLYNV